MTPEPSTAYNPVMDSTRQAMRHVMLGLCERAYRRLDNIGEWWIDRDGQAEFADGDIGDYNHERLAMSSALGIHDESPYEYSRISDDQMVDAVRELPEDVQAELLDDYGASSPEELVAEHIGGDKQQFLEEGMVDLFDGDINPTSMLAGIIMDADLDALKWFQENPSKDARDWAMENENWIRVQNKNFQLYTYDDDARDRIIEFLHEVMEEDDLEFNIARRQSVTVEESRPDGQMFEIELKDLVAPKVTPARSTADVLRSKLLPGDPSLYSAPGE